MIFRNETTVNTLDFLKSIYKKYNLNYPKFFKMDNLCKLGFLTNEILLSSKNITNPLIPEATGIVISNASSSLDTDFNFQNTIKDSSNYFPRPAVFVYTLPNILIGEICIKQKITGESIFFVCEKFDASLIFNYVSDLFETGKVKQCICGWVDLIEDKYNSVLFFIERSTGITDENTIFNEENISTIFLN